MSSVIDLRDPALREEWQLSLGFADTVLEPSRHSNRRQEHRGRAETQALILDALRMANRPLTRLEIARAVGRAKTPWLIALIDALVADGLVRPGVGEYRGLSCWKYEVLQ